MFERRNFPLLLLPLTLVGAFVYFIWSARQSPVRQKKPAPAHSALAEKTPSGTDQQLEKFKLTGFDEKGGTDWNLEGDTANIKPGQTVFLDQNVTLHLKDNTIIKTDHVQWTQDGGVLRTDALVHVDHEGVQVRGRGAYGKPNDGFIQLNRDIEMTMKDGSHLVCKGPMKIYYNQNKMFFFRQVKVTDQRGVLSANRMNVLFDPVKKKIKQILAVGNVVIERGTDTTHSRRAIYTMDTGSLRLEGNPEITLHKTSSGIFDGTLRN